MLVPLVLNGLEFQSIGSALGGGWPNGLELQSVCPYVQSSVRPSTKSFSDFDLIWCVGTCRPRLDMCTSMTLTQSKVKIKVTELLNFQKNCTFLVLSPLPFWHGTQNWWLIMIIWNYSMSEPNFWISFLVSYHVTSNFANVGIRWLSNVIFPYCVRLESLGRVCW